MYAFEGVGGGEAYGIEGGVWFVRMGVECPNFAVMTMMNDDVVADVTAAAVATDEAGAWLWLRAACWFLFIYLSIVLFGVCQTRWCTIFVQLGGAPSILCNSISGTSLQGALVVRFYMRPD